jgi:ABC-2 type transport system ATP-binding protein
VENTAIHISQLSFKYPGNEHYTFNNLALNVGAGERFGLFGPNGAGKTTLMSVMAGLLKPASGKIEFLGQPMDNSAETKTLFGLVPQDFSFYHELTPIENLEFFGAWTGLSKTEITTRSQELLDVLGLADVRHKQVKLFSGGMKRRVNLALGVIHQPKILFLDEPTVGVDVQTRNAIIDYLMQLNKQGTTLIYTSHQLNEAEELCNNLAMIDGGAIVAQGTISELLTQHQKADLEDLFLHLTGHQYRD